MAGLKLLTKLDDQTCLKIAWRAAQDLGFALTPMHNCASRFTATKGNALLHMLAGPLAPHVVLEISVNAYPDANEIVLEKNTPWLTSGSMGVGKVAKQADELAQAITKAIEEAGSSVHERKEF